MNLSLYGGHSNTTSSSDKISLDSLYDRKREVDNHRLETYNKILKRIHQKIIYTSKHRYNEPFLFYVVPEFMIGVPRYNVTHCTIYIIEKLEKNNFIVKYTHPNMLFISWNHYVPNYKRKEIKNKYGIEIDGFGQEIHSKQKNNDLLLYSGKPQNTSSSSSSNSTSTISNKDYKNITPKKIRKKKKGVIDKFKKLFD